MKTPVALVMFALLGACGMPDAGEIAASRSALATAPAVAGEEFLQAAGIDTSGLLQYRQAVLCSIDLHTTGSDELEKTVTCAVPTGFLLESTAWVYEGYLHNCSYSFNFVRGGTDYSRLDEIDRTYGRAIDLAIKAGKLDVAVKIGQLRDYEKSAFQEKSATDVYVLWARAKSRWTESSGAFCKLSAIATVLKM